jgi:RND family efflux transporter MFP subunit
MFCAFTAAVGLAGGGYYLLHSASPLQSYHPLRKGVVDPPSAIHVDVTHPTKVQERTTVQPGSIQAFESVQLYAGVSGYLRTLRVDIGDRVKKGQVLAQVDVPELEKQVQRCASLVEQAQARVLQMQSRIASARAEREAAESTVPQAEALAKSKAAELRFRQKQLERMQDLFATKSIDERLVDEKTEQRDSAREAEIAAREAVTSAKARVLSMVAKVAQAEADAKEAEAEVKVAQAELEKAQVLVRFATVAAPFDGVITRRNFFPGDFVRAATEGGTQVPLLTVQRTDLMRVVVQVPDRDVPFCQPGNRALVSIDALPGEKRPAKVSRVARSEDPETRLMHVEIDLPNPTGTICNGMYGQVTIFLEKSTALTVPPSCLVDKSDDGKAYVYVVRSGRAHLNPVRIGPENGPNLTILNGLTPEDEVVIHPENGIKEGASVQVPANITSTHQ